MPQAQANKVMRPTPLSVVQQQMVRTRGARPPGVLPRLFLAHIVMPMTKTGYGTGLLVLMSVKGHPMRCKGWCCCMEALVLTSELVLHANVKLQKQQWQAPSS